MDGKFSFPIGGLAVCRPDVEILLLWPRHYSFFTEEAAEIDAKQLLLILDYEGRGPFLDNSRLSDEWKGGAYLVLSSDGRKGWVGEGWLVPLR